MAQKEPSIVINGHALTEAESTTVRMALTFFRVDMSKPDALGSDATGRAIANGYVKQLESVMTKMTTP